MLQRADLQDPVRLAGVLVSGVYFPLATRDAPSPLHAESGFVALALLSALVAADPWLGAPLALAEATGRWAAPSADQISRLAWRPSADLREIVRDPLGLLVANMADVSNERLRCAPTSEAYRQGTCELERLALLMSTIRAERHLTGADDLRHAALAAALAAVTAVIA